MGRITRAMTDRQPNESLWAYWNRRYATSSNRVTVLGELYAHVFGRSPNHARLGSLHQDHRGECVRAILACASREIYGDAHDYISRILANHRERSYQGKQHKAERGGDPRGRNG